MHLKPYTILKDKHSGETCWIIGAGTSLLGFYKYENRDAIHNDVVIAVNSAIFAMPWGLPHTNKEITYEVDSNPDRRYWISNDALCRRWSWWDYVKKSKCIKIVRDSWSAYEKELKGFLYFWPRPTSEDVINPDDEGLSYCSSVPTSIDLAIYMGCKKIYLLGVDQYMSQDRSHWWQFLEGNNIPRRIDFVMALQSQQKEAFVYNNMAYPALKQYADKYEVSICNCNPQSQVNTFSKITFDQALSEI